MAELHDQLGTFLRERRIQLNVVASSPRQGGTMLLICLGCAELSEGRQAIGLLNEPGNLGVLPGCRHNQTPNPRSEVDMDRLLLIGAQLALLQWRLEGRMVAGGCEDGWIERHRDLARRLGLPRIPGADGHYDPRVDATLLADVEALQGRLDLEAGDRQAAAPVQPPLILTIKEHTYNRNEAEFLRLLTLVKDSGGSLLFTTRRPDDCFHSFLLRRTVHFLSAKGNVTNQEITDVVTRLLLPSDPADADPGLGMEFLEHYATAGFSGSGDRIDLQRLRSFVGKSAGDSIDLADLRRAGQRIWDHGMDIMQISYANTERYGRLAQDCLPEATHLVDFDALLSAPDATLGSLAQEIPWVQSIPSSNWDHSRLRTFVNVPEAFVLPGSEIERNVWFKDTLSATGIRPRKARDSRPEGLLDRDPQACAELQHAYRALLQHRS